MNMTSDLEKDLTVYKVKCQSLHKTLDAYNIADEPCVKTMTKLELLGNLIDSYFESTTQKQKFSVLEQLKDLLWETHNSLMECHTNDPALAHEKADVQVEATFLFNKINKFLANQENIKTIQP